VVVEKNVRISERFFDNHYNVTGQQMRCGWGKIVHPTNIPSFDNMQDLVWGQAVGKWWLLEGELTIFSAFQDAPYLSDILFERL